MSQYNVTSAQWSLLRQLIQIDEQPGLGEKGYIEIAFGDGEYWLRKDSRATFESLADFAALAEEGLLEKCADKGSDVRYRITNAARSAIESGFDRLALTQPQRDSVLSVLRSLYSEGKLPIEIEALCQQISIDKQDLDTYLSMLELEGLLKREQPYFEETWIELTRLGISRIGSPGRELSQSTHVSGDQYNVDISGGGQHNVNVGAHLSHITQMINSAAHVDSSDRNALNDAMRQLQEALQQIDSDHAEEAEAVNKQAEVLIEEVVKERPNKTLATIRLDGLKQAAKNLEVIVPSVMVIVTDIIQKVQPFLNR